MSDADPKGRHTLHHDDEPKGDMQALWENIQEKPAQYIGAAVFLVAVVVVAFVYRTSSSIHDAELSSVYARALDIEDPTERVAALQELVDGNSRFAAHALYFQADAAVQTRDFDTATQAYNRLRDDYPDFAFLPDAVEGLGFIEEDQGNYEAAIGIYREVQEKWPESLAGRRQDFYIARCQEQIGNLEEAVKSYQRQLQTGPGSMAAFEAQQKLTDLRLSNPELFPAEDVAVDEPTESGDAGISLDLGQ